MSNETTIMRQQMNETRTALTDKLEALEHQGVDMVQGASSAVTKSVENVKDIVRDSVQAAKDSLDAVKDAFDLKHQVDRRPWAMLAGATALGFLGGYLGRRSKAARTMEGERDAHEALAYETRKAMARNGASEGHDTVAGEPGQRTDASAVATTAKPSVFANLGVNFHEELSQLKRLAVGTLLGIVRDMVANAIAEPLDQPVREVINGITVKLGGTPISGRLLPREWKRKHSQESERLTRERLGKAVNQEGVQAPGTESLN